MNLLVIGGAASGKSEYAEQLVRRAGPGPRYYVATMTAADRESRERIRIHRARREPDGYVTLECGYGLSQLRLPARGTVLLDCVGNLAANELFSPQGAGQQAVGAIETGIRSLSAQASDLILVTNEVGSGGTQYEGNTLAYMKLLGRLNRDLAAWADAVCEVVCGIPQYWKGEPPA